MKIVVIHGQNHKGSTYHITKLLLDRLQQEEAELQEFYANDTRQCIGCFNCFMRGEEFCPHKDQVQPVIKAIEAADVVIAESPNYCMGMSGQLKSFFDHMGYRWLVHRPHPAMRGKIGVAISTTAGAGASGTTKMIGKQMFWWGIPKVYRIAAAVGALSWKDVKQEKKDRIEKRVDQVYHDIIHKVYKVKPGIKHRFLFGIMKGQQKKNSWNPLDRQYWVDNGWI